MWRLGLFLTLLATPALAHGPWAYGPCMKRLEALKQLADTYEELPVAIGLTSQGTVFEVTASESGSWTIIVTMPSGIACGLAVGDAWETLKPKKKDEGPGL